MTWKKNDEHWVNPSQSVTSKSRSEEKNAKHYTLDSVFKLNSSDYREFMCGWGSAVINITITYPINKVIFRQILEGVPATTAMRQLYNEGIRFLYRGILPPLCQKSISLSLMFSVYEGCKSRLIFLTGKDTLSCIIASNIAGTSEAILTPLERVQTLLQDWRYHNKFKNTSHAFRYIFQTHGLSECYRGVVPIIYRNGLSNLMFFTLRDQSKKILGHEKSVINNFVTGALIGGFTSTVFYPMNVIKIHMQSKLGGEFEKFFVVIRDVYIARNRSILSFYKGVHLNYMRSFISWGVINAAYDFLKSLK